MSTAVTAFTGWLTKIKLCLPLQRKAARITQRQQELDEKMVRLTQGVERIADEQDRTRHASNR